MGETKFHTTSQGLCRRCRFKWPVPTTELRPDKVKNAGAVSYHEGLPAFCPVCKSNQVSYLYDKDPRGTVIQRVASAKKFLRDYVPGAED